VDFYVSKSWWKGLPPWQPRFIPKKVIVRMSDFKSNEYANLIGGKLYEPEEENPMLGFRGASRVMCPTVSAIALIWKCRALKKVRKEMGLTNVEVMIPFVRTTGEAEAVCGATGRERAEAWRQWFARYHDVRAADQCAAGR
jgi:pyruvate,water dikinase